MTNDSNTREKKFEQAAQELAQYIMVHEGNDYREFVEEGGDPLLAEIQYATTTMQTEGETT